MDDVVLVREKIDLVALISETVSLKRAGKNFKGLCPFHSEKSPSFMVSPERQIWHCFGCQKGGDCYGFVMEQEHIEFVEALRILAKRAGIELQQSPLATGIAAKKERLYEANKFALEFYHYLLREHKSASGARNYLENRQMNVKIWQTFKLGFAPDQRGALTNYLIKRKHFKSEELIEAGLSIHTRNGIVDFFWNRLMFPLYDHRDNIVGFAGRLLIASDNGPKYINTKETLIYHKGQTFFAIQATKESLRKANQAILVEGEFDALSCFQAGITNILAVKGTALTAQQVTLLSRYVGKVTVCFDGDAAGQEAIKRSIPLLEQKNLHTTIVIIPNGKDPDEAIKNNELDFKQALKHDVPVYDYLFEQALKSQDTSSAQGKKSVVDSFLPVVAAIDNSVVREHYLKKLSIALDTSYESLNKEIERLARRQTVQEDLVVKPLKQTRQEILEEYLVSLIVQYEDPKIAIQQIVDTLDASLNKDRAYQKIIFHLLEYMRLLQHAIFEHQSFLHHLPDELMPIYNKSLLFPLPALTPEAHIAEIRKTAEQLREMYLKERIHVLGQQIKQKEADKEWEAVEKLGAESAEITKKLQSLVNR